MPQEENHVKRGDTISRARDTNAESAPGARGTAGDDATRARSELGLVPGAGGGEGRGAHLVLS